VIKLRALFKLSPHWPPLLIQLLLPVCDITYACINWGKQCLLYQFHCSGALNTESNVFLRYTENVQK